MVSLGFCIAIVEDEPSELSLLYTALLTFLSQLTYSQRSLKSIHPCMWKLSLCIHHHNRSLLAYVMFTVLESNSLFDTKDQKNLWQMASMCRGVSIPNVRFSLRVVDDIHEQFMIIGPSLSLLLFSG